jgi:D-alanyl-D-alanine carboxypeptidase
MAVLSLAVLSGDADARRRNASKGDYSPPSAAIVVDANTGAVLHASNPDAQRHPASLTKVMTLYLLFERLEAGKLKLSSPLKVSSHAEDQAPTKLGLEDGQTIQVEDAIKGIITRSANDAAVVVAEALAGSEEEFARLMTRKAQALGMNKTVYKNASGLPNDAQLTTARDQAILGRAIQERFPTHYKYFKTQSFVFRGNTISNHNRLLGSVDGVDGIKTGYTRASGFNLLTSMRREKRHVVAVVLGGSSASSRDTRMRQLLSEHIASASTKRTASMIAEAATPKVETAKTEGVARTAAADVPAKSEKPDNGDKKEGPHFDLASASSLPVHLDLPAQASAAAPRATPGSSDPIQPVAVKTFNVKGNNSLQSASASASAVPMPFAGLPRPSDQVRAAAPAPATEALPPPPPGARPGVLGTLPASVATASIGTANVATAAPLTDPTLAPAQAAKPRPKGGWIIQVGAYPDEDEAKRKLGMVKIKALKLLSDADPFTEPTVKDGATYYRARFAGLNKDQAEAVCSYLKRNDVECVAIKN